MSNASIDAVLRGALIGLVFGIGLAALLSRAGNLQMYAVLVALFVLPAVGALFALVGQALRRREDHDSSR
jgi:phosphate/sulfate permease